RRSPELGGPLSFLVALPLAVVEVRSVGEPGLHDLRDAVLCLNPTVEHFGGYAVTVAFSDHFDAVNAAAWSLGVFCQVPLEGAPRSLNSHAFSVGRCWRQPSAGTC